MLQYTFIKGTQNLSSLKRLRIAGLTGIFLAGSVFSIDLWLGFPLVLAFVFYPLIAVMGAGLGYWFFFLTLNELAETKTVWWKSFCFAFMGLGFARLLRLSQLAFIIGGGAIFLAIFSYALYYRASLRLLEKESQKPLE